MKVSASYELYSFLVSLLIGAVCGIACDMVRSLSLKKTVSDIVMWLVLLFSVTLVWMKLLGGAVRWYIIAGAVLTYVLYRFTLSKPIFYLFSAVVKKIYCFFNIILKILLTAGNFLGKIVCIYKAKFKNNKEVMRK